MYTFQEFFAGGGMARAGLGERWKCLFANDIDAMKADVYRNNWGGKHFVEGDVAKLTPEFLPMHTDLTWASFPCQDLSLAGDYKGLGRAGSAAPTRSGTFWAFAALMRGLRAGGRASKLIVLENVYGALRSNSGRDFAALTHEMCSMGYRVGGLVMDAKLFVPQSRPRLFIVAVRDDLVVPQNVTRRDADYTWHPPALAEALERSSHAVQQSWIWWQLPTPPKRNTTFTDLVDEEPIGVPWHSQAETKYLLSLMSPVHLAKVAAAKKLRRRIVGGVYRRTRPDDSGHSVQRAEVRFDDIAGCLRTPAGGSSRQTILVVEGRKVRSRLLSPAEAARLMGLDAKTYRLPSRYNDAYHVAGDGVVVPVVRHLAQFILEPLLQRTHALRQAAE